MPSSYHEDSPEQEDMGTQGSPEEESNVEEVKCEALEHAIAIHNNFRAYSKKRDPSKDKELEIELIQQVNKVVNKLNSQVNTSPRTKRVLLLRARNEMLEITFSRMIKSVLDEESKKIWNDIKKEHNQIIQELLEIAAEPKHIINEEYIKPLKKQFERERRELNNKIASLTNENKKYLDTLIKRPKMTSKISVPKPAHTRSKETKRIVS